MFYSTLNMTSAEIAGAVAEAALHDLRVNNFSFGGFPQIHVKADKFHNFSITLAWAEFTASFTLTKEETKAAVKKFRSEEGFDRAIFDRVQIALATVERAYLSRPAVISGPPS